MKLKSIATTGTIAALALLIVQLPARVRSQSAPPPAATTIPTAQLMQPEELKSLLNATGASRPLILQVGSRIMYDQAHIPGSEFTGPGSREEGLSLLRNRVKGLAKDSFIVLYCGCCPWNRCPNVGGAYQTLHEMGFTNVKVLYIADNFGSDWVNKGYPVVH
jgi:3-mercaptopyruvate sulfurtransferase SseA